MNDDRYEVSADMRLLKFQRDAIGAPVRVLRSAIFTDTDPLTAGLPDEDDLRPVSGTVLLAQLGAQPRKGLIPGAVVTVSLSIENDGDAAARKVRIGLPLPADTTYRAGSATIDGVTIRDERAHDFFGGGLDLGDVRPGARRTFVAKIMIEAGVGDILLAPHVSAATGAVLGLLAMRLMRSRNIRSTGVVERPFYEIDDAEAGLEQAAASTIDTIIDRPEYPPVPVPPAAPPSAPAPVAATAAPAPIAASTSPAPVTVSVEPEPEPSAPRPVVPTIRSGAVPLPRKLRPDPLPADLRPVDVLRARIVAEAAIRALSELPRRKSAELRAKHAAKARDNATAAPRTRKPRGRAKANAPTVSGSVDVVTPVLHDADAAPETVVKVRSKPHITAKSKAAELALAQRIIESEPRTNAPATRQLAGRGGPILGLRIDRKRLATLGRLFEGPSLGMIAHYWLLAALAATQSRPADGADPALAAFVVRQELLLSRALITIRLGKTPRHDHIAAALPAFPPAVAVHPGAVAIPVAAAGEAVLARAFAPADIAFCTRLLANSNTPPFLRGAQLLVALCATNAVATSTADCRRVSAALGAYAAVATAEIGRIFLRAKLVREPSFFGATDPAFDAAARRVIGELGKLIA